ncbi:hypothetical protein OsJ_02393 [Oryza sativa Japonica Group]|uniref:Uncharacterized protein n=1 Tax=Oryza sativa subsp. japonica TaxID=39947 RepID=A2ZUU9_ORYSJ|nr:hypothetical protein OsJ_02393 [Oryza sativa Japonica Group]
MAGVHEESRVQNGFQWLGMMADSAAWEWPMLASEGVDPPPLPLGAMMFLRIRGKAKINT